jgi:DNA-binding response OmpR family regulator
LLFTGNLPKPFTLTVVRILIVEDKQSLARHLSRALEGEGHTVTLAYDGDEGFRLGKTNQFDLMILDVMLPRQNGFEVIRKLRSDQLQTQTIIVSARDSMQDIVTGLDSGADDYLTKPFALGVLLAKVRASERRVPAAASEELRFADLVLRAHSFELQRGHRVESLTRTECALLKILMRRATFVVPHAVLIEEGWADDTDVSFDSLYVFVRALRAKITQPGETELLHTVRGVGYSIRSSLC